VTNNCAFLRHHGITFGFICQTKPWQHAGISIQDLVNYRQSGNEREKVAGWNINQERLYVLGDAMIEITLRPKAKIKLINMLAAEETKYVRLVFQGLG
jgi:hypothetical protein